ncbi:MAG: InlB B-repeat-containing protein, partial [Acholeplasma sp.]
MKKISILFLAFFSLLFVSMHAAPSVFAGGSVQHDFKLSVVKGEGHGNRVNQTLPSMNFGQELSVDLTGVKDGKEFAFYVYNGQMETDEEALFMISGSTNLSVVLKDNASDVVAAFVDTNGELIDVKYNSGAFTPSTVGMSSPSKPGYAFDGYDVSQISEDTVFVAKYSRTNQTSINVTITGGTKDLEVVQYNDVVTLTPNAGNFSYWADEDGQVVSKNANYAFSALQDVTLNAVFDAPSNTDPVVYLSNVTGISPDTQSFLGHIEGDFVEYGVLASMNEEVLTLDSEDVEVIPSQGLVPLTNEFLRSIPSSLGYKSFRAYAKLASGEVYYSDNNHFLYEDELSQEYNEDFSSLGDNNSYSNREIDGNSIIWNATDAREDQSLNGKAITIRSGILSTTFPSGLSNLMFNYKKTFSDNDGAFSIYINNIKIGDTIYLTNGQGITQFDLTNLNYTGPVDLEIHIENRVTIDDITWTDLTLTNVETKLYNIKFIEDENNSIDVALEVHKKLTELIDPIKEGYTFLGWFDEEENLCDFDTPITRHMTLTAEFEINEYTLTFDTDGGSSIDPITQDFESAVIAPSNPT